AALRGGTVGPCRRGQWPPSAISVVRQRPGTGTGAVRADEVGRPLLPDSPWGSAPDIARWLRRRGRAVAALQPLRRAGHARGPRAAAGACLLALRGLVRSRRLSSPARSAA